MAILKMSKQNPQPGTGLRIARIQYTSPLRNQNLYFNHRYIISVKRENLYNKFKNECVNTINKLLEKASNDEKEGLLGIKEQLLNQQYCEETIVTDIAKLLEIRDVLLSE